MINSRRIEDLDERVQEKCKELIKKAKSKGINLLITSTYRDGEQQNLLYAQGRTKIGKIVTNAKSGDSMHNYKLAFDVCILDASGKNIIWDLGADTNSNNLKDWDEIGTIGEKLGLAWGGRFKNVDKPHFQWTNGLTLSDLKNGKRP